MNTKMLIMDLDLIKEVTHYGNIIQDNSSTVSVNNKLHFTRTKVYSYEEGVYMEVKTDGNLRAFFKVN